MTIITGMTEVFSAVLEWLIDGLTSATAIFVGPEGLTTIGLISLMSLGFSIALFLFNWIRDVLNFRR